MCDLFLLMAVVCKKSLKVYGICTVFVLFETNFQQQRLVPYLAYVGGVMHSAQVDKVESASAHNEQSVAVVVVEGSGQVVYDAALVRQLKLTYSRKSIVYGYRVSQQVGVKFHTAQLTDVLLFFLGLYW